MLIDASLWEYNTIGAHIWQINPTPATTNCIRALLKFDDLLVMLTAPNLNNGISGFRSGQELKKPSDFIEF
jgi:hypothetical protein